MILVVAFGALVAAGIPLLLGITAVAAALGLTALLSHLMRVDQSISSVILLIGLAVGVDYSLFYLRRAREERARGRTSGEALQAAAATSGRAVLFSGFVVITAMAGMFLMGSQIVRVVRRRHRPRRGDLAASARSRCCRPCSPSSATASSAAGSRSSPDCGPRTASRASGARSSAP